MLLCDLVWYIILLTCPFLTLQPTDGLWYAADAFFTTLVINTLGILVWFALWTIGDVLILPEFPFLSCLASLCSGYVLAGVIFSLQSRVHKVTQEACQTSAVLPLAIEDCYKVLATVSTLSIWRGLWGMARHFIFADGTGFDRALTFHLFGFLIMIAIGVSTQLMSRNQLIN